MGGAARRQGMRTVALVTLSLCAAPGRAEDLAAENRLLKERLRLLESKVDALINAQAGAAKGKAQKARSDRPTTGAPRTNVANAAQAKTDSKSSSGSDSKSDSPPPVFVSFKNGLFVETEDKAYSFKVGGRVIIDGGGITQPLNGRSNDIGFRQIRLEVEGKAAKVWFYKLQYDFAGQSQITGNNQVIGGIRDAFFGIQHPAFTPPFATEPVYLMVGSMFEPFSMEAIQATKWRPTIERAMAVDAIAPARHIGFAAGLHGDDWSAKIGVFSTSAQDAALSPAQNTPATWGVPRAAGWVSTGGSQYVDITGRATYAPIKDEHNLLHIGVSGRYHRPNDSTGASNDQVLRIGNRIRSEANILGQGLLGAPDLSCGSYALGGLFAGIPTTAVAGHCTRDVTSYGFEVAGAYGPLDFQAEYLATDYNRNMDKVLQARASGVFAPGGASHHFSGYYLYGQYWLTGEERAATYDVTDKNSANFGEPKIKKPVSAGGLGAFSLIARYSALNLNSGPYSGSGLANLLAYTTYVQPDPVATAAVVNAGVAGGRQENLLLGFNWFPERGVHLQFNWTHVLHVSAPLNDYNIVGSFLPQRQGFYMNGAHPDIFEARAQVYW